MVNKNNIDCKMTLINELSILLFMFTILNLSGSWYFFWKILISITYIK